MIILSLLTIAILWSVVATVHIRKYKISYGLVALCAIVIALLSRSIDVSFVADTLRGDIYIQPWKILVIFFSAAYVAISLDANGVLEYLAYKISRQAKTNKQLFLYFFLLAGFLTIFTSNDIVILMLTPIIIYLGRYAKAHVIPLLIAEFIAANTFSMVLYTGDPTNIILASTMKFTYLGFTKLMILPTLCAALAGYIALFIVFKKQIRGRLQLNAPHKKIIRSPASALLASIIMLGMLVSLVFSEYIGVPIWAITLSFMSIALIKDFVLQFFVASQKGHFVSNIRRLPWNVLPFIIYFFLYVHALSNTEIFASIVNKLNAINSPSILIVLLGAIASTMANIINNHPATILTSTMVTRTGIVTDPLLAPTSLAIVIATSVGATFTLLGTLAGVMWQSILKDHNITMLHRDYMKISFRVVPFALGAGLVGLYLSTLIFK